MLGVKTGNEGSKLEAGGRAEEVFFCVWKGVGRAGGHPGGRVNHNFSQSLTEGSPLMPHGLTREDTHFNHVIFDTALIYALACIRVYKTQASYGLVSLLGGLKQI